MGKSISKTGVTPTRPALLHEVAPGKILTGACGVEMLGITLTVLKVATPGPGSVLPQDDRNKRAVAHKLMLKNDFLLKITLLDYNTSFGVIKISNSVLVFCFEFDLNSHPNNGMSERNGIPVSVSVSLST